MLAFIAAFLTISARLFTYVAVGLVRNQERRRGEEECDERIAALRRALQRRPPPQ